MKGSDGQAMLSKNSRFVPPISVEIVPVVEALIVLVTFAILENLLVFPVVDVGAFVVFVFVHEFYYTRVGGDCQGVY